MKTLELLIMTRKVGYKSQSETAVKLSYRIETEKNDLFVDILGDTWERIIFERFEVSGADLLRAEYINFERHLMQIAREYIKTGDTLKKGAGLLGAHQICYVLQTEAYDEMRRCQAFLAAKAVS